MNEAPENSPFPLPPLRTVVLGNGRVGTVEVGSMADYLDEMEKWLLQELQDASQEERADAEAALRSIQRQRQELASQQSPPHGKDVS